jgi:hypothetical protein
LCPNNADRAGNRDHHESGGHECHFARVLTGSDARHIMVPRTRVFRSDPLTPAAQDSSDSACVLPTLTIPWRIVARLKTLPRYRFIAVLLALVYQLCSNPPEQGVKPGQRLDTHMHNGGQIVAPDNVAGFVRQKPRIVAPVLDELQVRPA